MHGIWTINRVATGSIEKARQFKIIREVLNNLGKFELAEKRIFESRRVEIVSPKKMTVIVPGRKEKLEAYSVVSQNISNPNPLNITIQRGRLKQNRDEPNKLLIQYEGMVSIGGEKRSYPSEKREQPSIASPRLPVKNPDLTSVDGMEFHRAGTLQVTTKLGMIIILS